MICGKTIYVNRQQAMQAINGMGLEFARKKKRPSRTYFCDLCNGWHVNTEGKGHHKKRGKTRELDTKNPPDKQVIGKSQAPLIIHDVLKFKIK